MTGSSSPIGDVARLVRVALDGEVAPAEAARLVAGDADPVALCGEWAGGGALLASEPVAVARAGDDPFATLDRQPRIDGDDSAGAQAVGGGPFGDDSAGAHAVGGGWFGYLGYGLGARVEPVPPPPRRPAPLPPFALAFYDHVVRCDRDGRWWFERCRPPREPTR